MLELGFNMTEYGKAILAACFINDLGTVLALGLIFSPFTLRTLVFVVVSAVVFVVLPLITPRFFRRYGGRVSELEMGSVGDAYDNAMCESFFATLECEWVDRHHFRTQADARLAIFDFIEGSCGLSPVGKDALESSRQDLDCVRTS